jgi:outer membrane murein-binding lipoprotein Lpp
LSAHQDGDSGRALRQSVAAGGVFALAAIVVGVVLVLANYTSATANRSEQQVDELAARIDALTVSQKLIAAQLGAQGETRGVAPFSAGPGSGLPKESAPSVVPFNIAKSESDLGVSVAAARFTKVDETTTAGWPVAVRFGNYLDGMGAFNIAASHGDVFQGSYYVDESTKTVDARLLRAAAVTVYGWKDARATDKQTRISASELAQALSRDDDVGRRWRDAWFWIKLGPNEQILAAVEMPPQ